MAKFDHANIEKFLFQYAATSISRISEASTVVVLDALAFRYEKTILTGFHEKVHRCRGESNIPQAAQQGTPGKGADDSSVERILLLGTSHGASQ